MNRSWSEVIWPLLPLLDISWRAYVFLIFSWGIYDVCLKTQTQKLHLLKSLFQFARSLGIYELVDTQVKSNPVSVSFMVAEVSIFVESGFFELNFLGGKTNYRKRKMFGVFRLSHERKKRGISRKFRPKLNYGKLWVRKSILLRILVLL